jgi:hypothetical protein
MPASLTGGAPECPLSQHLVTGGESCCMTVPAPDCLTTATLLPLLSAPTTHTTPSQVLGAHAHNPPHSVFPSIFRGCAYPAGLAQQCLYCCCHAVVLRHWVLLWHGLPPAWLACSSTSCPYLTLCLFSRRRSWLLLLCCSNQATWLTSVRAVGCVAEDAVAAAF